MWIATCADVVWRGGQGMEAWIADARFRLHRVTKRYGEERKINYNKYPKVEVWSKRVARTGTLFSTYSSGKHQRHAD